MPGEYTLVQLGSEFGGVYMSASPDLAALVAAGAELARYFPGTEYGVQDGSGAVIWSSKEQRRYVLDRQIGDVDQLLAPGHDLIKLLQIGSTIAQAHPDWQLAIRDPDRRIIWQSQNESEGRKSSGT